MGIGKMLIILAILSLNFATLIFLKNKIASFASVAIVNLLIVLCCVINIDNYQILKSLIVAIVVYSTTILTVIYNANQDDQTTINLPTKLKDLLARKLPKKLTEKLGYGLVFVVIFTISCGVFCFVQNSEHRTQRSNNLQLEKILQPTNLLIGTSMGVPADLVLLDQNNHQLRLQNNVLLKGCTDAILIIVGVTTSILLTRKIKS